MKKYQGKGYLWNTRRLLKEHLGAKYKRDEIQMMFHEAGFKAFDCRQRRKHDLIEHYYSQRDWSQKKVAEALFAVVFDVLMELKQKCSFDIAGSKILRKQFSRILVDGVRQDGAELYDDRVYWRSEREQCDRLTGITPQASASNGSGKDMDDQKAMTPIEPHTGNQTGSIDFFIVSALTEEHQVITTMLNLLAETIRESGEISHFRYKGPGGVSFDIATACAHQMGAVSLGVFIAPLLHELRPKRIVLLGIAAAVNPSKINLGDVPYADQVISLDNIAVQDGMLFRPNNFPTDPFFRRRIGHLRTIRKNYLSWQKDCDKMIKKIVPVVNSLKCKKITIPTVYGPPHILVGNIAGGPFLIRDADFRDALYKPNGGTSQKAVRIITPVHVGLLSAEMESHGFMRAAHEAGIPAAVLKGISDLGDPDKKRLEEETGGFYRVYACSNAILVLLCSLRQDFHRKGDCV